jgi:SAM-dependent methyltransferase
MSACFASRNACPACGSSGFESLFARPYGEPRLRAALTDFYAQVGGLDYSVLLDAEYALARCDDCGLIYQVNIPNDVLLSRLYEEWISPALAFARFHRDLPPDRCFELAHEVKIVASLTGPAAPRLALDYGCGWGEWSRMTQAFGYEAWGTELSLSRRVHAEKSGIHVVPDAGLPDGSFGLINIDQVLEHVPSPRDTLGLLTAKLHPGGVLRVGVPNGLRVRRALRSFDRELKKPRLGRLNPVAPLEHLNCFTARPLLRLAGACGLRRVRPTWKVLLESFVFPPGIAAKLRTLLRPFYLRSGFATQLYFRRTEIRSGDTLPMGTFRP